MPDTIPHIIQVSGNNWYVETRTGFDGPFPTRQEASEFQDLIICSNAARVEFAGLQYLPAKK